MWCDLRKPVTWCKIDILSYWYHVKVWIILFPELFTWISSDTGIKSYWCSKAIKNKKNIRIMMLISFILQFHPLRHVTGFPRSHHIIMFQSNIQVTSLEVSNRLHGYVILSIAILMRVLTNVGQSAADCYKLWKEYDRSMLVHVYGQLSTMVESFLIAIKSLFRINVH